MDKAKLEKFRRLMELTKGNMTTKSFYGAFEKVVGHILKAEKRLMDRSDNKTKEEKDNLANLSAEFTEIMAAAKSDSSKTFGTIRKRTVEAIDKMFVKNDVNKRLKKELDKVTSVLANIKDGEPGKLGKQGKPGERGDPGPPGEAADEKEIVETVLARIQIPVIDYKRFDDFESKMREELRKGKRIMTPARPTVVNLMDSLITDVADNEVFAYDSVTSTWINQTALEANLGELSLANTWTADQTFGNILSDGAGDIATSNTRFGSAYLSVAIVAPEWRFADTVGVHMITSTAIGIDKLTIEAKSGTNIDMRITLKPKGTGIAEILSTSGAISFGNENISTSGILTTSGGRLKNNTRVTTTYTILATDDNISGNTDSAGFTVTLPAGVADTRYRIVNTGSSGNTLTLAPNGSEHLIGVNSNFTLNDGESIIIIYDATDGWY